MGQSFTNEIFENGIIRERTYDEFVDYCDNVEKFPTEEDQQKCKEDPSLRFKISQYDCSTDYISVAKEFDPINNPKQGYPGGMCCYVMAMEACEPNSIINF